MDSVPASPTKGLVSGTSNLDARFPEPFYCLRCNQDLYPKGKASCPSCNHEYDSNDEATFRRQPLFLRWKYWFPGLCLSIASGAISYAVCLQNGELGFALFVAVPVSFGAILGYGTRVGTFLKILLITTAILSVMGILLTVNLAGAFCGITLVIVFLGPAAFGMILGVILRLLLEGSRWDQRWFLPLIAFIVLPYVAQGIESSLPHRQVISEVRTRLTVDSSAEEAWNAVMFYEQVEHEPPWLLRLALPKPVRSVGDKTTEGEIVRCFYDRGYLSKRISRVEPRRRLRFEVVEQELHFERDIKLLGGSFELLSAGDKQTEIVLTTRYERLLSPQWLWKPIEHKVVHSLHEHVLDGMRRKIEADSKKLRKEPPYRPTPSPSPQRLVPELLAESLGTSPVAGG